MSILSLRGNLLRFNVTLVYAKILETKSIRKFLVLILQVKDALVVGSQRVNTDYNKIIPNSCIINFTPKENIPDTLLSLVSDSYI